MLTRSVINCVANNCNKSSSYFNKCNIAKFSNFIILGDEAKLKVIEKNAESKIFYFTASWCPPCKAIGPVFEKLSKDTNNSHISFVKIDIDNFPESTSKYMIRSVPTFVFLNGDKKVSEFSGADEVSLRKNIQLLQK